MASARGRVLAASQSNELREVFGQLADIDGPAGAKFTKRVLTALAARIVGRAYETPLLELCHLVRAAELVDKGDRSGFEWLFWGVEVARPSAYRAAFAASASTEGAEVPSRTAQRCTTRTAAVIAGRRSAGTAARGACRIREGIQQARTRRAELPLTETAGVAALPLSYLRTETFGSLQNRLTQALCRAPGDVAALIAAGPNASHPDCVAALASLAQHTRQVMQATLYVLRRQREDSAAVDLAAFAAQRKARCPWPPSAQASSAPRAAKACAPCATG